MGLFDFLKPKRKKIDEATFNTAQFQYEILALAQSVYFEKKQNYESVAKVLASEGLDNNQVLQVIGNLKKANTEMVHDFKEELESGRITEIKITPNPEHQKGNTDKDQVDKYIGYGAFQMERGDLDNALELFDKALELDDTATLAYANKGTLYAKKGDNELALQFYNKALQFEPNHVQILENKMDLLFEMLNETNEKAFIDTVNTILKNDPEHPNALIYIIQFHLKENDIESAVNGVKQLFPKYYAEQIVIQLMLGTFDRLSQEDAVKQFDAIEKALVNEEAKYQLQYNKGLYLKGIGKNDEAITLYDNLNKIQEFSWNYYQMAIMKNLQGKTEECLALLKTAFTLEPELKNDAKQFPELQNLWDNPQFIELTT